MRQYLGPKPPVDYQVERDNHAWTEHVARMYVTAGLIAWQEPASVIDPACGDGSILRVADDLYPIRRIMLGDISQKNCERWAGTRAAVVQGDALESLGAAGDDWDMVVLTEILEHVEDPDALLRLARAAGGVLVASSPEMRSRQFDQNPEHLWMFDDEGYREMLGDAGWTVVHKTLMTFPSMYDFGIWVCA